MTLSKVRTERARRSLAAFCDATCSFETELWQHIVCERLQKLQYQTGQRIIIHGPPQHGKSIIVSQRFPCWLIGKIPDIRIGLACYNQSHATSFGKINLELMQSEEYAEIFPEDGVRLPRQCSAAEFATFARKKHRDAKASFLSLGIGSGFTGKGIDLLIVDDPYKNRDEAYSETVNGNVWLWWTMTVLARLNPKTNVVVMFHRWKDDDLGGRLLAQGKWESLRFPAICDGGADDPTFVRGIRKIGESLTSRYDVPYLRDIEQDQGAPAFAALYQGRPVPAGGNIFKEHWFAECYQSLPEMVSVQTLWDTALKDKEQNDETACLTYGEGADGNLYILRVVHGRWETPDVAEFLAKQARWFKGIYGDVYKGDYVEDKVSGTTLMQYMRRTHKDVILIGIQVEGDKVARAQGVTPLCQTLRVKLPDLAYYPQARQWVTDFLGELLVFPGGKHDDIVDVFVYALKLFMGTLGKRKSRKSKGTRLT